MRRGHYIVRAVLLPMVKVQTNFQSKLKAVFSVPIKLSSNSK